MLNLDNIDMTKQYGSAEQAVDALKSYIFQLRIELDYRLEELDRRLREIEEKSNDNATS